MAVLFQRGLFDARATELTAAALQWFAVGLAGHAAVEVLVRGFFAMQDARTPVLIGVGSLAVHMVLSWLFAQVMGHAGIALGVSIGVLIEAMVLGLVLARRDGLSLAMPVARSVAITLTATLVMGLVIAVLRVTTWSGGDVTGAAAALLIGYLAAAVRLLRPLRRPAGKRRALRACRPTAGPFPVRAGRAAISVNVPYPPGEPTCGSLDPTCLRTLRSRSSQAVSRWLLRWGSRCQEVHGRRAGRARVFETRRIPAHPCRMGTIPNPGSPTLRRRSTGHPDLKLGPPG